MKKTVYNVFYLIICNALPIVTYASAPAPAKKLPQEQVLQQIQERREEVLRIVQKDIQRKVSDISEEEKLAALKFKEDLINHYKPTPQLCRPTIIANDKKPFYKDFKFSLIGGRAYVSRSDDQDPETEGSIACMIAGYKKVFQATLIEFAYYSQPFKDMLKLEQFDYVYVINPIDYFFVLFSSEGRENALLLLKESTKPLVGNAFIQGFLLGYHEDDIKAFYRFAVCNRDFEQDKKEALSWIEQNKPSIETWAQEHIDPAKKTIK